MGFYCWGGLSYGMAIYSFWNFLDLTYDIFIDIKKKRKIDYLFGKIFFILFSLISTIIFLMSGFLLILRFLIDIINNLW